MIKRKIALIGSTGSIGRQTLSVCRRYPEKFEIVSLSAGSNASLLAEQIKEFKPKVATIACQDGFVNPNAGTQIFTGEDSFTNAILDEADVVVVALVGFKGIIAVLDAISKKKDIALANKESLVVGGGLVMRLAKENGVSIAPIDSEHSAIWQALNMKYDTPFKKIILTASGGAFRDLTAKQLETVTAQDALKHPNWDMGAKITVDCATLVNKGFEVIEAKWLYGARFEDIEVIIHRESIIHSMVEFVDGSTLAQMSYPSMELPIQLALTYPERLPCLNEGVNFAKLKSLTFSEPDHQRFPCLNLVIQAGKMGGCYPAVVNGANEQAVKLFLQGKISYLDIYESLADALDSFDGEHKESFENFKCADEFARRLVLEKFKV